MNHHRCFANEFFGIADTVWGEQLNLVREVS